MKQFAILVSACLAVSSAHAQAIGTGGPTAGVFMADPTLAGPAPAQCKTPLERRRCAARDLRIADAFMAKSYDAAMAAATTPVLKAKLRQAQRAWLTFRDQECAWEAAAQPGETPDLALPTCWLELTKTRDEQLAAALTP